MQTRSKSRVANVPPQSEPSAFDAVKPGAEDIKARSSKPVNATTTWDFYLVYGFIILPLRAIVFGAPVVLAFLVANALGWAGEPVQKPWVVYPLMAYCASEVLFTLRYLEQKRRVSPRNPDSPRVEPVYAQRKERFESTLAFANRVIAHTPDMQPFIESVFYDVPFEQLSRKDLRALVAYLFYHKCWTEITTEMKEVDAIVTSIYKAVGMKETNQKQLDHDIKPLIRHTIDDFECLARPWVLYAITKSIYAVGHLWLGFQGFECFHVRRGFTYWRRPAVKQPVSAEPIVFVHGIGSGLTMYLPLLLDLLAENRDRDVYLLDMPVVSMQFCDDALTRTEILDSIDVMMTRHAIPPCFWMGHSLGTLTCSYVCQDRPEWVAHVTFIDPVMFYIWRVGICFNFLYRVPRNGMQAFIWYFASQEVHIAHAMRHHFFWTEMILFPEHLPFCPKTNRFHVSIFLSGDDEILDAHATYLHLQHGIQTHFQQHDKDAINITLWEGLHHGQMIIDSTCRRDVLDTLHPRQTKAA
ncbi:unnamed protein product [Aphanomyces euteiches]